MRPIKIPTHLIWTGLAMVLFVPAFLINLGIHPFIEDEAIRATVAMEMMYSDQYILPTLNGEPYLYKPPLYNWILVLFYNLFGSIGEFTSRLPTIIFLACFGGYIYWIHRQFKFNSRKAILIAFMYITCGRILFWDGFLGLIDIFYSMVTYIMITMTLYLYERRSPLVLFLVVYILTAIGFMLKGYPSLVFLGATLVALAISKKDWKYLIHPPHLLGILILVVLLGSYYYALSQQQDLSETIDPLLTQSTSRTIIYHHILDVVWHIITYPFENIYHFLPWTLMVVFLVRKSFWQILQKNEFVKYSAIAFLLNILVYWVSPQVYPRYILMLVPLFFTVVLWFSMLENSIHSTRNKIVNAPIMILMGLVVVAYTYGLFANLPMKAPNARIMLIVAIPVSIVLAILYYRSLSNKWLILVVFLLCVRMVFNVVIVPIRTADDDATLARNDAYNLANKYNGADISIYDETYLDRTSSFYLQKKLGYIIPESDDGEYFILDPKNYAIPDQYIIVDSLYIRRSDYHFYLISKPAQ